MKDCEDCKHYCGTTYTVDHDEQGEVHETSQCSKRVLATGRCRDFQPKAEGPSSGTKLGAETRADILREMRTYFQRQRRNGNPEHRPWHQVLSDWADRIEAAAERETDAAIREALANVMDYAPGNAVMREALKRILAIEGYGAPWIEAKCIAQKALEGAQYTPPAAQETANFEQPGNAAAMREALEDIQERLVASVHDGTIDPHEALGIVEAALSAPPRNCDVGTADEQADRFKACCYANRTPDNECTKGCQFNDTSAVCYCQARWAQMPYEGKEESNG